MVESDKKIKCYIVNRDVSIFEYEILENVKTFQVEIVGKSGKRYIINNFKSMKKAKEYLKIIGVLDNEL